MSFPSATAHPTGSRPIDGSALHTLRYLLEATPSDGGSPVFLALNSPLPPTVADLSRARPAPVCACSHRLDGLETKVNRVEAKIDTILAALGLVGKVLEQNALEQNGLPEQQTETDLHHFDKTSTDGPPDADALPVETSASTSPENDHDNNETSDWINVTQEMEFVPDDDEPNSESGLEPYLLNAESPDPAMPYVPEPELERIYWGCRHSRTQFALKLVRRIFRPEERVGRTCSGRLGRSLDPVRVAWLRRVLMDKFGSTNELRDWRKCIQLIDKDSRRIRDRFAIAHSISRSGRNGKVRTVLVPGCGPQIPSIETHTPKIEPQD